MESTHTGGAFLNKPFKTFHNMKNNSNNPDYLTIFFLIFLILCTLGVLVYMLAADAVNASTIFEGAALALAAAVIAAGAVYLSIVIVKEYK